jgi:hypothetical protein
MSERKHNYVSMGRNPNWQLTCGFPRCGNWKPGEGAGGWCQHPQNRVPPQPGWPNGFTPSTITTGGCDLHTSSLHPVVEGDERGR